MSRFLRSLRTKAHLVRLPSQMNLDEVLTMGALV